MIRTPEALAPLLYPVENLRPNPENPRKDHDVDGIAAELEELGWHAALVATEDGELLIGHGRLLAAKKLGAELVPVVFVNDDREQAVRRMVSDNRLSELSSWDDSLLANLVEQADGTLDHLRLDEAILGAQEIVKNSPPGPAPDVDETLAALEIPEKDKNIQVTLSIHPAIWLSKRGEILDVIARIERAYEATARVKE